MLWPFICHSNSFKGPRTLDDSRPVPPQYLPRASEKIVGGYNKTHKGDPPGPAVPGRTRHKNSTRRAGLLTQPASRAALQECAAERTRGPKLLPVAGSPRFLVGVHYHGGPTVVALTTVATNQPTPTNTNQHQPHKPHPLKVHGADALSTPWVHPGSTDLWFRECGRRGQCRSRRTG